MWNGHWAQGWQHSETVSVIQFLWGSPLCHTTVNPFFSQRKPHSSPYSWASLLQKSSRSHMTSLLLSSSCPFPSSPVWALLLCSFSHCFCSWPYALPSLVTSYLFPGIPYLFWDLSWVSFGDTFLTLHFLGYDTLPLIHSHGIMSHLGPCPRIPLSAPDSALPRLCIPSFRSHPTLLSAPTHSLILAVDFPTLGFLILSSSGASFSSEFLFRPVWS